jgi:hypothetical protein
MNRQAPQKGHIVGGVVSPYRLPAVFLLFLGDAEDLEAKGHSTQGSEADRTDSPGPVPDS